MYIELKILRGAIINVSLVLWEYFIEFMKMVGQAVAVLSLLSVVVFLLSEIPKRLTIVVAILCVLLLVYFEYVDFKERR